VLSAGCTGYVRRVTHHEIADYVGDDLRRVLGIPVLTTWIIRSENWLSLDNYGEYFWVFESTTVFFEEKNFKKKLEASPQLYFARKSFCTRKKTVLSPQLYS
jgi:hypothetical protein